jgi:hypothetical protein
MSPPKRRPNLPRSPVNSQPTNIGHRRQLFGLVDHEQMFWSPLPLRIDGRSEGLD